MVEYLNYHKRNKWKCGGTIGSTPEDRGTEGTWQLLLQINADPITIQEAMVAITKSAGSNRILAQFLKVNFLKNVERSKINSLKSVYVVEICWVPMLHLWVTGLHIFVLHY